MNHCWNVVRRFGTYTVEKRAYCAEKRLLQFKQAFTLLERHVVANRRQLVHLQRSTTNLHNTETARRNAVVQHMDALLGQLAQTRDMFDNVNQELVALMMNSSDRMQNAVILFESFDRDMKSGLPQHVRLSWNRGRTSAARSERNMIWTYALENFHQLPELHQSLIRDMAMIGSRSSTRPIIIPENNGGPIAAACIRAFVKKVSYVYHLIYPEFTRGSRVNADETSDPSVVALAAKFRQLDDAKFVSAVA
jgi:hypothetical protein